MAHLTNTQLKDLSTNPKHAADQRARWGFGVGDRVELKDSIVNSLTGEVYFTQGQQGEVLTVDWGSGELRVRLDGVKRPLGCFRSAVRLVA